MRTMKQYAVALVALGVAAALPVKAAAQTATVEQTIQILPEGAAGGQIRLPGMMGGPRQFKTGTGRIRGRVLASDSQAQSGAGDRWRLRLPGLRGGEPLRAPGSAALRLTNRGLARTLH